MEPLAGPSGRLYIRGWMPLDKETWSFVCLISAYTFLLQFKPSEPHLVPYLIHVKGFSNDQVTLQIFPISVYVGVIATLAAAPLCDLLSYRTVIIIGSCVRVGTRVLLIWGTSLFHMQLSQVTYGVGEAAEVVFASYIYLVAQQRFYQPVTSISQAALLVAFVVSAELGQVLVNGGVPLSALFYISLATVSASAVLPFAFPGDPKEGVPLTPLHLQPLRGPLGSWATLKATYSSWGLAMLSIWWVIGTAVFGMLPNYGTNLFEAIDARADENGHVVAAARSAACVAALCAIWLAPYLARTGALVYVLGTVLVGAMCLLMASARAVMTAYVAYVCAMAAYQLLVSIVYVQCALLVSNRRYSLLFGLNSGAALLVQALLQGLVEAENLSAVQQFYLYGICCISFALLFTLLWLIYYLFTGAIALVPSKAVDGVSCDTMDPLLLEDALVAN
eukprot:jgi/Mesen1/7571/ME000392S06835